MSISTVYFVVSMLFRSRRGWNGEILLNYKYIYLKSRLLYSRSPKGEGVYCFTSVLPSVQDIFRRIFLSNCWWQKSDILSQASYRYTILWVAFLDPSDSYFLFADFVDFYTHWTYMLIFLSHYWWQKFDIWSQALYRYPISWEAFFDPSYSYFLFAEERGYHKWALAHSASCLFCIFFLYYFSFSFLFFFWEQYRFIHDHLLTP
jgi:hypothetical protein